jgi:4-amino-4-deoxy-L-arabinose transferase-like glycosyltransferase
MNKKDVIYQLSIITIGGLLLIPFIGQVHLFDWDEINFAESAREMILTHDYLTVRAFFEPFWEKPPLFIWLQVLSMKIFGINEFAARFPNAICGIFTFLVIYNIGRKLYNSRFGLIWVIAYGCSLLPFFYFKSGIIDPWFNLFIFISIYFWVATINEKIFKLELFNSFMSAAFMGLAVLTKGPAAVVIFILVAFILFVLNGFKLEVNWKSILLFIFSLCFIGGFWFLLQIATGHYNLMVDFIVYQIRLVRTEDAGHGGFPLYHFIILLIGVFPASIFAIQGHRYVSKKDGRKVFHTAMIVLLWVVLILFSIIKTKIIHYSSLSYFPLTYLAAYSAYMIIGKRLKFRKWQKISIGTIGLAISLVAILLPVFNVHKQLLITRGIITDEFTAGNLNADPGWTIPYAFICLPLVIGLIISLFFKFKDLKIQLGIISASSLIFICLAIYFVTPGAEKISQNASIEFIIAKSKQDVYVHSFFKSYAPPFYSNQPVPADLRVNDHSWLTKGDIDKDAYFIERIDDKEEVLKLYPRLEFLYEKNGYIFFVRHANPQ